MDAISIADGRFSAVMVTVVAAAAVGAMATSSAVDDDAISCSVCPAMFYG